MKGIWITLLVKIIGYLTSAEFVNLVKELVLSMVNADKTGEEKRAHVLEELKKSSFDFGSSLASLALESIVSLFKIKGLEALK